MLFNSFSFTIFLPIVFILYWAFPQRFRWVLLLISSYYFYMSWNPKYVVLILGTTFISYLCARLLYKTENQTAKKLLILCALVICLGTLFFFKYFNFFSESVTQIISMFSIQLSPVTLNVLLPVGISFYTFQTLSYVLDVYRGKVKPEKNFGIYATFISFFPQLVAGPIERTENLLPQITKPKVFDYDMATYGLKLMAWGFFKKLAIADVLGAYVDSAYYSVADCNGYDYVIMILFFTIQIYCDFSGYSDIAIGTAKLLGINLMKNFDSPYFSASIKEFWRRWHISLSTWFRDYVYIPLGGSRCSKLKNNINLMITFLVSGLWHGASWTFVIWGGIHGLGQIVEKYTIGKIKRDSRIKKILLTLLVFIFCNITWVFFRAQNLGEAFAVFGGLFSCITNPLSLTGSSVSISTLNALGIAICLPLLCVFDYYSLKFDVILKISALKKPVRWIIYVLFIWIILVFMPKTNASEFVYFQF